MLTLALIVIAALAIGHRLGRRRNQTPGTGLTLAERTLRPRIIRTPAQLARRWDWLRTAYLPFPLNLMLSWAVPKSMGVQTYPHFTPFIAWIAAAYRWAAQIVVWSVLVGQWIPRRLAVGAWNRAALPILLSETGHHRRRKTIRAGGVPATVARALPAAAHHQAVGYAARAVPLALPAAAGQPAPPPGAQQQPDARPLPIGRNDRGAEVVAVLTPAGDTAFVPFIESEDYVG